MENNITKTPWRCDERDNPKESSIPFAIIGNIGNGYCEPVADICNFPPASDGQSARQKNNGQAIVNAINFTYGKGIDPSSVPELLEALKFVRDAPQFKRMDWKLKVTIDAAIDKSVIKP